jgi:hypothetical protein
MYCCFTLCCVSVVQVDTAGEVQSTSHLIVSSGGITVNGGVLTQTAQVTAGSVVFAGGSLSLVAAPTGAFAADALWSAGAPTGFVGNAILGRTAAGVTANLMSLYEGNANVIFQVLC